MHSVFLDIDGTLITDKGGPFDDDIAGIERARQRGTKFFLCTGRSMVQIDRVLGKTPWKDGIVAAGGAHTVLGEETLYHNWIPVPVLCEVAFLFLTKGKTCSFRGDKNTYAVNKNGSSIPITSADDFAVKYADAKVSMLTVDLSMGDQERAYLEKYFDMYPQVPHFDCFIKGEGKAKGAQLILERLGLDRKKCVAIGDSTNDLDILEFAGTGIAVGNACDALKEKADWISTKAGEGAIVNALKYLGLC
jgi:Cof subfamily protein (haloacid dehalogenase superfamily)